MRVVNVKKRNCPALGGSKFVPIGAQYIYAYLSTTVATVEDHRSTIVYIAAEFIMIQAER